MVQRPARSNSANSGPSEGRCNVIGQDAFLVAFLRHAN